LSAKAYSQNPADGENQLGFRTIDWYNGISDIVLQRRLPAILLQAGSPDQNSNISSAALLIAQLCQDENVPDPDDACQSLEPLPANVISCNFQCSNHSGEGLFSLDSALLNQFHAWLASKSQPKKMKFDLEEPNYHPLEEYVLLPSYDWGVSDWHLDVIKPFIKKHRPVVGFNPDEARFAKTFLAIGDLDQFSEDVLDELRQSGCRVERISGNGTSIATSLAQR